MAAPLWEFASQCYQHVGVAEACLALQDAAEADVNMLLTAAWLAGDGKRWQTAEVSAIVQSCAAWRARCLLPLRQIRRDMRELIANDDWYQHLKALELAAEQQQLSWIEDAAQDLDSIASAVDHPMVLEHNLKTYLATLAAITAGHHQQAVALLIERLTEIQADSHR